MSDDRTAGGPRAKEAWPEATLAEGTETRPEPDAATLARPDSEALGSTLAQQIQEAQDQARRTRALPAITGYELLGELGRGAMGVVYHARELVLDRQCALKMILAGGHADPYAAQRFLLEAGAVARLRHPNIVAIHRVGETSGLPFLELEFVEDGSLDRRLGGTPWLPRRAAELVEALTRGAAAAHAQGIVHRDLKPGNILLAADGTPKITDFGLAKALESDSSLTASGAIMGTPSYMAPEQAEGKAKHVGPPADVHALGAILYELLVGRPPFRGASLLETLEQVKGAEPVPPSRLVPGLPRDLETIALKCLQKDPSRRYAAARDLGDDLRRFLANEPVRARRIALWEKVWKWARRRPALAALFVAVHVLGLALLGTGVWSYFRIRGALGEARTQTARALLSSEQAKLARGDAEASRNRALNEASRATLSEARALRLARPAGWRDDAIANLARLTPQTLEGDDLRRLRSKAVACLAAPDLREVARLEGHRAPVLSLDFSADGALLASADLDGRIHLWRTAGPEHLREIIDPGAVRERWHTLLAPRPSVRFRPDGGLSYTSWSARVLSTPGRQGGAPPPIAASGFPRQVAVADDGRMAVLWNSVEDGISLHDASGKLLERISFFAHAPIVLSPDGKYLATEGPAQSVQLHNTAGGAAPVVLGSHKEYIRALAFSRDGALLASGSADHTIKVWDVARRRELFTLVGHKSDVADLAFSPDGDWIVSVSDDHTTRVWDARSGQSLVVLAGSDFAPTAVAFSPDGEYIATAESGGIIRVYRAMGRRELVRLAGHRYGVECVAFDPTRDEVATGADDLSIRTWNAASGRLVTSWQASPRAYISTMAYHPGGNLLAAASGGNGQVANRRDEFAVTLWDRRSRASSRRLIGHDEPVRSLAFDALGRTLASGDEAGSIRTWDVATGRETFHARLGGRLICTVALSADGKRLIACERPGRLATIDLDSPAAEPRYSAVSALFQSMLAAPDGETLFAGDVHGRLYRIDARTLKTLQAAEGLHNQPIEALALSPDGRLLASGGLDRRVVIWDPATLTPLFSLPEWTGIVKSVAFDRSSGRLAVAGIDSDAAVWDLRRIRPTLAAMGLEWDQSDASPGEAPTLGRPTLRVAGPGYLGETGAASAQAGKRLDAGFDLLRAGRFADSLAPLRESVEAFRTLLEAHPGTTALQGRLGLAHGALGAALRQLGRTAQAIEALRESCEALEALLAPTATDAYNLACSHALLSSLVQPEEREAHAARAIAALRRAFEDPDGAGQQRTATTDTDLDPIRARPEFTALLMDLGFPADPFAPAPALAQPGARQANSAASYAGIGILTGPAPGGIFIHQVLPGGPAARDGRLKPGDIVLGVEQDVLFADRPDEEVGQWLRGRAGTTVRVIVQPRGSQTRAVYTLTRDIIPEIPAGLPAPRREP